MSSSFLGSASAVNTVVGLLFDDMAFSIIILSARLHVVSAVSSIAI